MSNWISVEERLPETDDSVLVHPGVELENFHQIAEYDMFNLKCFVVTEYQSHGVVEFEHKHVTHWMPLPEPPNTNA